VDQPGTGLEQRLSELQAQIDRLQRAIEHGWTALRQLHEEPARQLREQAASLADVCVAAATSSQRGVERAEARLAVLESDLQRSMAALSRDVQMAVAELRPRPDRQPWALAAAAAAGPTENVTRLHSQLRRSSDAPDSIAPDSVAPSRPSANIDDRLPSRPAEAIAPWSESSKVLSDRMSSLEQALADGQAEVRAATGRSDWGRWNWRIALVVFALGAVTVVWQLQRQAGVSAARVVQAERQAQIATDAANRQLSAAREETANQIATARDTALKAQLVSDVLAAPDTVRFILTGVKPEARVFAQVLWSRSRGFVFSGSRIPPPPEGATYQIWLATSGEPVSAGVFVPDASGRITIATDSPPPVPRPVIDVRVTIEPDGGQQAPSGATLLARATPRPATP
jgi:hypothetical protein